VDVGIVSAYILARGGEGAIVDTGVAGSTDDIEAGLTALDLRWNDVGHVILTHLHPDHVGSLADVLAKASAATGYAGAPDIDSIPSPRTLTEVGDGDEVFGLRIVATPGHTPGSISVLDPIGGVFVAGDALTTTDGKATGPNPQFSVDMDTANASVKSIAALEFGTLLVGHGAPIEKDAAKQVAALAATL
jgi:glyoxylase-like metal-dependent hydrolase (beta-lactamase superfamily II)